MIYKKFQDLQLSALGMGAMRFPVIDGDDSRIDEVATQEMMDYSMEQGINYYDTAWGYHGGNSEIVMGKVMAKYPRESFYLASKFPGFDLANIKKIKEIFEKQLEKCKVDYFDFYLFHNVCESNIDDYLNKEYGILDYLMEQKRNGRIRHLGFSTHGSYETMKRFLDACGEHMEFCQIQLNYLDWTLQDAKEKVELLKEYDMPIWVMEPVRGGRLAKLPEEAEKKLTNLRPEEKIPAWAFRFLQGIPEVTMILSGMSNLEQLSDNIKTFEQEKPLNNIETETLLSIAEGLLHGNLACTSCKYCVTKCPKGLEIPSLIEIYNEHVFSGDGSIPSMALEAIPKDKQPSACIGCKSCEAVCPQNIKIANVMSDFTEKCI